MKLLDKNHKRPKRGQTKKREYAIALDVGGTFLKSALVSSSGSILEETFKKTPIDSQDPAEPIIGAFVQTLKFHLKKAQKWGLKVAGIGIGIPGPFDCERGISMMKHKFGAICGLNLKHEFIKRLGLPENFLIRFEIDSGTFLRGEAWLGVARGYNRIIGITLGTGLGSAFMVGNQVVGEGPGVPPYAWIGCLAYEEGIVEDKISRRGIITRYKEVARRKWKKGLDVKEIAFQALRHGDKTSLQVFEEIGRRLGQVLSPIVSEFGAECLVLGGQISKSFSLFSNPLQRELRSIPTLKKIVRARKIDLSPLYGAGKLIFLGPLYKSVRLNFEGMDAWYDGVRKKSTY